MAAPLVVLPLAAAGATAAGAGLRAGGAFAAANQMMPDAFRSQLADLEARERAGELGLTDTERLRMEQDAARRAGQALANDQSRQLQQAQMLSGGGAFTGREFFVNEMMTQENQARMAIEARRQMIEADERERRSEMATMMELQQRAADAAAARKQAGFNLAADIVTAGATAGLGIAGANQAARGATQMASATAGSRQAQQAAQQMMMGQMAMGMAGAYGAPMVMPAPQPAAVPIAPAQPLAAPAFAAPTAPPMTVSPAPVVQYPGYLPPNYGFGGQ
jgi:hypothetical protein